jgi:hypothetical protein
MITIRLSYTFHFQYFLCYFGKCYCALVSLYNLLLNMQSAKQISTTTVNSSPRGSLYKSISVYLPLDSNWLRHTGSRTSLIATADDALLSASQRVSPCDVIDPTTTAISTAARKYLRRHSNVNEKGYASVSFLVHFTTLVKLTLCRTFLIDKLTVTWLVKNVSISYRIQRSITIFTTTRHYAMSQLNAVRTITPYFYKSLR